MPAEIIRQSKSYTLPFFEENAWLKFVFFTFIPESHEIETENRIEVEIGNNKLPTSQSEPLYCQYPRRGSVPSEIPLVRGDILTRHSVSLNGKASGRRNKKQLRRRSSGGPETVCLIPDVADTAAWHRIRREIVRRSSDFQPDAALVRRRGSLPIEVLTLGHSGNNRKRVIFKWDSFMWKGRFEYLCILSLTFFLSLSFSVSFKHVLKHECR